jgi:heme A synthase
MQTDSPTSTFFPKLALATALLTVGLIVLGAVVRVTDSGLGCGNAWPLCDGRIIPPLDNLTAWIEWSHRLFATLIGLFGLAMLYFAVRIYRGRNSLVFSVTVAAAILFFAQSALGALVVVLDLPPTMVTVHLGTAMLLFAALLIAGILAQYRPVHAYERDNVTTLAYITTALALVIILTGALVRGSGATLACTSYPLCNGAIFPFDQGQLQTVHMMHRFAVVGLGVSLALLVWYVLRGRDDRNLRLLTIGAMVTYLAQAGVGAIFVVTEAEAVWGAAHVGLAATTWGLLVTVCTLDTLNSRENAANQEAREWTPQSEVTQ